MDREGAKTAGRNRSRSRPGRSSRMKIASSGRSSRSPSPPVPQFANPDRVRTPVDAFVLAQLRAAGARLRARTRTSARCFAASRSISPACRRRPRRSTAFLADTSPDAYEKVVDRLLASPAYGERWARHWLDVAGYADSNGFAEADSLRPQAWRYRDYVIRSFNADKPWNEFIVEQLAGDELAGATHAETHRRPCSIEKRRDQLDRHRFPAPGARRHRRRSGRREARAQPGDRRGNQGRRLRRCSGSPSAARSATIIATIRSPRPTITACARSSSRRTTGRNGARRRSGCISLYTPEERAKAAEIEKQAQRDRCRGAGDEQEVSRSRSSRRKS